MVAGVITAAKEDVERRAGSLCMKEVQDGRMVSTGLSLRRTEPEVNRKLFSLSNAINFHHVNVGTFVSSFVA